MRNVYLTASARTPIGRFGGTLASWTAADLGVAVAKASIGRAGLRPDQIQQSIWGCARQAGGGPNVARQITYRADRHEANLDACERHRKGGIKPIRGTQRCAPAGQPGWGA